MIHDTQARVQRLYRAVSVRQRRRQSRQISALQFLCCMLFGAQLALLVFLTNGALAHNNAPYLFGASILSSDAGGYVLVAVISFTLAATFTLLCIKQHERKKMKTKEEK